ncbi:hypothetical protein D9M73_36760 [compost metagenome]
MIAIRPMRSLLSNLPKLPTTKDLSIDFPAADPALLLTLAEDAEMLVGVMHLGIGSIGQLLSQSAVALEDGTTSADCLEALGYLMAELGDMAASCTTLAGHCRLEIVDYNPPKPNYWRKTPRKAAKAKSV